MLYLQGRKAVVVGTGEAASERVTRLRAAGAEVAQVTPAALAPADLAGALVMLAMAESREENTRAAALARDAGCLVYAHDLPACSDFAMPALARRGPLQIAIATDGVAPALSRRLRQELSRLLDEAGARLDAFIAKLAAIRGGETGAARNAKLSAQTATFHIRGHIDIAGANEPDR